MNKFQLLQWHRKIIMVHNLWKKKIKFNFYYFKATNEINEKKNERNFFFFTKANFDNANHFLHFFAIVGTWKRFIWHWNSNKFTQRFVTVAWLEYKQLMRRHNLFHQFNMSFKTFNGQFFAFFCTQISDIAITIKLRILEISESWIHTNKNANKAQQIIFTQRFQTYLWIQFIVLPNGGIKKLFMRNKSGESIRSFSPK